MLYHNWISRYVSPVIKQPKLAVLSVLFTGYFTATGMADENLETRKYSYESLSRFWNNTIVDASAPDANRLGELLIAGGSGFPVEGGPDDGCIGRLCGAIPDANNSAEPENYLFYVRRIPADFIATLSRREVALHMYLNRDAFYEAPKGRNIREIRQLRAIIRAEARALLSKRIAAALELYYIKLVRYLHADNLGDKCAYIQEANFYQQLVERLRTRNLRNAEEAWEELVDNKSQVDNLYDEDLASQLVCQVQARSSKLITQTLIEEQVNALTLDNLNTEYSASIEPMNATLGNIEQQLNSAKGIETLTPELLQFEQNITAAAANISFVFADSFGMGTGSDPVINQVNRLNLSGIEDISVTPSPLANTHGRIQQFQNTIASLLNNFESFYHNVTGNEKSGFQSCVGLDELYRQILPPAIDLDKELSTTYPGFIASTLVDNFNECLGSVEAYFNNVGEMNPEEKMVEKFAQSLRSLSTQILYVKNP